METSPSWGGHLYAVAATTDDFNGDNPIVVGSSPPGRGWGCDSDEVATWLNPATHKHSYEPSCIPARSGTLVSRQQVRPGLVPFALHPTLKHLMKSIGEAFSRSVLGSG